MKNAPTNKPQMFNKEAKLTASRKNLTIRIFKNKVVKEELAVQPKTSVKIVLIGDSGIINLVKEKVDKVHRMDLISSRIRDK